MSLDLLQTIGDCLRISIGIGAQAMTVRVHEITE